MGRYSETPQPANKTRNAGRALAWSLTKRILQRTPIVGTAMALGLAGYEVKRKGLINGALNVALNATPFVGTAKNVVEMFTGDLLPDKKKDK